MDSRYLKLREREKAIDRELIARNTVVIGGDEFDHEAWLKAEHREIRLEMRRVAEIEQMDGTVSYE